LRIRALADGFRRAGRAWGAEPVDAPLAELPRRRSRNCDAEPLLAVEDIDRCRQPSKP
jgi:hypothetical protein